MNLAGLVNIKNKDISSVQSEMRDIVIDEKNILVRANKQDEALQLVSSFERKQLFAASDLRLFLAGPGLMKSVSGEDITALTVARLRKQLTL